MFERYSSGEYKKLLVCTLTDVEWVCPFKFEKLPLLSSSYNHFVRVRPRRFFAVLRTGQASGSRGHHKKKVAAAL